jgi:hypothetical protein
METRSQIGIDILESLPDEAVLINVPEAHQTERVNHTVRMAEWKIVDNNEYVEIVPRRQNTNQDVH